MQIRLLKLLLAVFTICAIGVTILAILILVDKVQTEYWLETVKQNELLEPSGEIKFLLMNSSNQFLSGSDTLVPIFGSRVSPMMYNSATGSVWFWSQPQQQQQQEQQARTYLTKESDSTKLVLSQTTVPKCVLRLQLTAGNNRGFLVWFDVGRNESFWLSEHLTWSTSVPATRPFLFLVQDLVN